MEFPPGLLHLIRVVPFAVFPPALIYGLSTTARSAFEVVVPTWATIIACILIHPILFTARNFFWSFNLKRKAANCGASVLPHVELNGLAAVKTLLNNHANGYIGDIWQDWIDTYGNVFAFTNVSEYRVLTAEPEHIKAILATQFKDFGKGPHIFDQWTSLLGSGVFNSDGDMWQFHRSMTRPFFTRDRISDFDIFSKHTDHAVSLIKDRLAEGYPIEFQDVVARFTLDSATEFLFGRDVKSMSAGLPYPASSPLAAENATAFLKHPSSQFVNALATGQLYTVHRSRLGDNWRLLEFWKNKINPLRAVIDAFTGPVIREALEKRSQEETVEGDEKDKEGETVLSHLVKNTQDLKVIQDELVNLLVAGRDTTAGTLTFAVYIFTQHPEIVARLRREIFEKLGNDRRPTYDDIKEMKYLRAFINETLRLYPVVPYNARYSMHDTTLPATKAGGKPFFIPADTKCAYSVFHMHRRTDLWGPDADIFDPSRFIDQRLHKYLTPNPFIFLPFNAGPRICLGQQFAYNEMSFFLIRLLQVFSEFSLTGDAQPEESKPPSSWGSAKGRKAVDQVRFTVTLTMFVKSGCWVRMKEGEDTI